MYIWIDIINFKSNIFNSNIYIYHTKVKEYKEETYYKITKVSYFNVRHNAWKYGEYLIYKYLKDFENQGAKFLFNIYIPKKGNETTEIDV